MKEVLIKSYRFNFLYAEELVTDVEESLMAKSPGKGLENHPAFTLGHLSSAAAMTSRYLGGPYDFLPEWEHLFKRKGPGDPRLPDSDELKYPAKETLIEELKKQHQLVEEQILNLDEKSLKGTVEWRFHKYLPTLGDMLYFMCISHESMHLSQLAGWRRAMGLSSALARL